MVSPSTRQKREIMSVAAIAVPYMAQSVYTISIGVLAFLVVNINDYRELCCLSSFGTQMALTKLTSVDKNYTQYRRTKMGRMRENPRYNVISMRISDEERETLEQIVSTTNRSVSDIMREAMDLVKERLGAMDVARRAA
jgi:hypothetical protein